MGEFGESCILRVQISQLLGDKFFISLAICFASLILAYLIAIPVGIYRRCFKVSFPQWVAALCQLPRPGHSELSFGADDHALLHGFFQDSMTGLFSAEYRDAEWSFAKFLDFIGRAWLPVFVLGWSATAFALQTVRALMLDEVGKLYVTAARARGVFGGRLLRRYPARHALGPIVNSLGFDLNRIFNELPVVALILTLTEAGALLIEALARSNDQQLAGAIIFLLTATIVALNFLTDIALALLDPRMRKSVIGWRDRMTDQTAGSAPESRDQKKKEAYFTASQTAIGLGAVQEKPICHDCGHAVCSC